MIFTKASDIYQNEEDFRNVSLIPEKCRFLWKNMGCHSQPQTCQTPDTSNPRQTFNNQDTSNLRHIKPQTKNNF